MPGTELAYALVGSPEHRLSGHPERPERLLPFSRLDQEPALASARRLEPEPAEDGALLAVHRASYLEVLQRATQRAPALLDGGDTYVTQASYSAARRAAGAALAVVEFALGGDDRIGLSLARPPGHHAEPERALGFCLLNNVAIGARRAQEMGIERILILDFDVHHGNGTQVVFDEDPQVYYVSLHQWGIFPGTGALEDRGHGPGAGTTLNLPLPARVGHEGYLKLLRRVLPAVADRFQPELTLVSAGFDAHWRDPLAQLQLTEHTYHAIGSLLRQTAADHSRGQLGLVLEGGYDPAALYSSLLATVAGLLNAPAPPPVRPEARLRPEPDVSELLARVLQQIS